MLKRIRSALISLTVIGAVLAVPTVANADTGPTSVFYSPTPGVPGGITGLQPADLNIPYGTWAIGDCAPDNAVNIPSSVSTLAGWSRGRLGPIYFLALASPQQQAQIHTIILFDPGDTTNFADGSCDSDYDINALLANWLQSDSANRLLIFTGAVTEEWASSTPSSSSFIGALISGQLKPQETFAGLWQYYLAGIWNQPFAAQALICDYPYMGHDQVLEDVAGFVQDPPDTCPSAPDGQQPISWNP